MVRPGADHAEKKLVDLSTGVEGTRIVLRGKADAAVGGDIVIGQKQVSACAWVSVVRSRSSMWGSA